MVKADLNILISNVLNENRHKHCRLCLKDISDSNFVRFGDCVSLDNTLLFQPLSEILIKHLGEEVCEEIPGLDTICSDCVEKVLEFSKFFDDCRNTTTLLNKIFDNLSEALNLDIEDVSDRRLYVIVGEDDAKVIISDKEVEMKTPKDHGNSKGNIYVLQCKNCALVFSSKEEFIEHEKHKCSFCDQCFSEQNLKEHEERIHITYVCKTCGKPCQGLDKLHLHEERHNSSKQHKCPKCEKLYLTKDSYTKHVQLCLSEKLDPHPYRGKYEKRYFCKSCDKGYSTLGGLRVHDRFVHGDAKPHVCEYCGKKFTAPSYLKAHMITHTGEKNYNCNICSGSFVTKEALLYHTRRHTGEKPYSCDRCNEKFVNASARAEHIKFKHVGPKLTCDICKKKFFTSSFLKQHIKRHYDPMSKLFIERASIPPNIPGDQNMRVKNNEGVLFIKDES